MNNTNRETTFTKVNKAVFFPPLMLILLTIIISLVNNKAFLWLISFANKWVLENFGWLFSWSAFLFVILLLVCYFSPLAKVKIGGKNATPILNKWRWFAISICTTIATGILFWGCAEPLYHYAAPPTGLGVNTNSAESMQFALSTMYMHWSFTPYAIYCVTGLVFALAFYNLKQPFRIAAIVYPLFKNESKLNSLLDVVCLYSLVLGMSASLGAGILAIMGGVEHLFGFQKSNLLLGVIGLLLIISFIISAVSGLQKGIKWLSSINIAAFIFIALYVIVMGFPLEVMGITFDGLKGYTSNFIDRSVNYSGEIETSWLNSWSIFYWANWFAWAPVTSLFLGKIAKGYTVRQYINFNLIIPSVFAIVWMSVFSGTTLLLNETLGNSLYNLMKSNGEEAVMYAVLSNLKYGGLVSIFTLIIIFLSYVTAADSNISAMSSMSAMQAEGDKETEAPIFIKVVWGLVIGALTYIMLSTKGIDGIRMLSVLGGFPALFIIILAACSLLKFILKKGILKEEEV